MRTLFLGSSLPPPLCLLASLPSSTISRLRMHPPSMNDPHRSLSTNFDAPAVTASDTLNSQTLADHPTLTTQTVGVLQPVGCFVATWDAVLLYAWNAGICWLLEMLCAYWQDGCLECCCPREMKLVNHHLMAAFMVAITRVFLFWIEESSTALSRMIITWNDVFLSKFQVM
ncbi:hypothetical protein Drorol1_Dr00008374 [Drosera rotundifolia]